MKNENDFVTVTLPRATGREENFVFVGLNGKGWNIMKGVPVRVPRAVAQILKESLRQQQRQADYIRQRQENAARSAVSAGL